MAVALWRCEPCRVPISQRSRISRGRCCSHSFSGRRRRFERRRAGCDDLGWKLALAVRGFAGEDLLESYHTERHPVGVALCQQSRAQVQLFNWTPNALAMRDCFAQLMQLPAVNRLLAEQVTALAVDYSTDQSSGRARIGRRVPDFALSSGGRIYEQLHRGQFLLIDPAGISSAVSGWEGRVQTVQGAVLDAPGAWAEPAVLLCRPDGYLAWRGEPDSDADTLLSVLQSWCGPPATAAVK